jgi:hypothetical protein
VSWIGLVIAAILHRLNDWSRVNGHWLWIVVITGKSRRNAQFGLPGLVAEFLVDGGAEFRLGSGPLLPSGMHRRTREAADRADRRLVRAHRDERCLPPAGLLCSQPQRLLGGLGVIHSYDNGHIHSLLWAS